MTLVFLGDVDRRRMAELERIACGAEASTFTLRIDNGGYWPRQKIVWAAPQSVPAALQRLVCALEAGLRAAGFQIEDRAWRPHVTLLRDARRPAALPDMALAWPLREFVLVESARGDYRVIGRWALAAI
jgi:2'-5' RNA ligase